MEPLPGSRRATSFTNLENKYPKLLTSPSTPMKKRKNHTFLLTAQHIVFNLYMLHQIECKARKRFHRSDTDFSPLRPAGSPTVAVSRRLLHRRSCVGRSRNGVYPPGVSNQGSKSYQGMVAQWVGLGKAARKTAFIKHNNHRSRSSVYESRREAKAGVAQCGGH